MSEIQSMSIQKMGLRNGIVSGIISIIYTLILYAIGGDLMFKTSLQTLGNIIPLTIMAITIQQYRKSHGNYVSFRQAFGGAFSVSILGLMLPLAFAYILYAFIDPDLTNRLKDYTIKNAYDMMQWFNASDEQIGQALDKMQREDYSPQVLNYLKFYAGGLVFMALLSAIVAFVFWLISRKNEPAPEFGIAGGDNKNSDSNLLDN
ncbi:hypothetical protein BH09BAC1_BH09BAC1_09520 [soil metagenome]